MIVASAGRSTPGSMPNAPCAAITDAPVWPALNSAAPRRRATASAATGSTRAACAAAPPPRDSAMLDRLGRVERSRTSSARRAGMPRAARARSRAVADEQQPDLQMPRRDQRAVDDAAPGRRRRPSRRWRCASVSCPAASSPPATLPAPTRITSQPNADGNWNWNRIADLCFFDRPDLAAVVVAAVRADLVRRLRLRWHCGQSPTGTGFSASCVRRLAVRVFECRRFGFGTSSSPSRRFSKPLSGRQPRIFPARLAVARRRGSGSCRTPGTARGTPRAHSGFIGSASWNCSRIRSIEVQHALAVERRRQIVFVDLALRLRRRSRPAARSAARTRASTGTSNGSRQRPHSSSSRRRRAR